MIYRAVTNLPPRPNHTEPAAFAGQLLFPWRASQPKLQMDQLAVTVQPNGWGGMILADRAALDPMVQPGWEELPLLADFYLSGGAQFPHLELAETPEETNRMLDAMACCAGWSVWDSVARVLLPGESSPVWARAFMSFTQSQRQDGTGALLIYHGLGNQSKVRAARFKICDHQKLVGAGARPNYGWHPGKCAKCGLDLTVDSGD